jgi:hypothetical protein
VERLEEGIRAIPLVTNARGIDLARMRRETERAIAEIRAGRTPPAWGV